MAVNVRICNAWTWIKTRNIDVAWMVNWKRIITNETNVDRCLWCFVQFSRHYGVLLLYGQHLALNHLVGIHRIRVLIGHNILDQSTTDNTPNYVQQGIRLNLHCWHTNDRFSKFAFKLGQYPESELAAYKNDTTARAYVTKKQMFSFYFIEEKSIKFRFFSHWWN